MSRNNVMVYPYRGIYFINNFILYVILLSVLKTWSKWKIESHMSDMKCSPKSFQFLYKVIAFCGSASPVFLYIATNWLTLYTKTYYSQPYFFMSKTYEVIVLGAHLLLYVWQYFYAFYEKLCRFSYWTYSIIKIYIRKSRT